MSSVCPSVCPSVTLVDQDHIGWKSWKLIARTLSPTPSLWPSTYSQGNMGKFGGDYDMPYKAQLAIGIPTCYQGARDISVNKTRLVWSYPSATKFQQQVYVVIVVKEALKSDDMIVPQTAVYTDLLR